MVKGDVLFLQAVSRTPAFFKPLEDSEFDLRVWIKGYPTSSKCQSATYIYCL